LKGKPTLPDQCVAGIDIGGTKIALAVADLDGRVLERTRFPARTRERGPHAIVGEALAEVERMLGKTGHSLTADNDANAAALGEHRHGAGQGYRHLVYITQSTGIGGGVIVRGELVHGVCDGAGEVGHMTVLPDGPECGCGGRGCLEALCSGTGIARRARERLADGAASSLSSLSPSEVTARAVAEAARGGDALAAEVWGEMIHYLAVGVGNIFNVLAPEAVVIGGGVSEAGEQLFGPLRERVRDRARMLPPEKINILQASLGGDSALHGAVILGQAARQRRPEQTS
jgi:glucokinase